MTPPTEKRRLLALDIGRVLGALREARGESRREVARGAGFPEGQLEAIEWGTAEATAEDVVEILVYLRYGVEDLMAVLAATRGKRSNKRSELAQRLGECLDFPVRCSSDRPLSALLGVGAVEGLRSGVTWGLIRVFGRFWNQVDL